MVAGPIEKGSPRGDPFGIIEQGEKNADKRKWKMIIENVMDELLQNPFWGIDKIKTPDMELYRSYAQKYNLPQDYLKIMHITDGFVLFHGGDYRISDIDWVLQCKNDRRYNPGYRDEVLDIGYFLEHNLLINQHESHTSSYLYAGFAASFDDYVCVGTITDFLVGFINAKGKIPFWQIDNQETFDFRAE